MFYTIFEAVPYGGKAQLGGQFYKSLLPHLHGKFKGNGFHEDAFSGSPYTQKGVNVAIWENADAAWQWRNEEHHIRLQEKGSEIVYESYRLRIGPDSQRHRDQNSPLAKGHMTLLYRTGNDATPPDNVAELLEENIAAQLEDEIIDSTVYQGAQTLWITGWRCKEAAIRFEQSLDHLRYDRLVHVEVQRDYTKSDRRDAPHELPGKL